MRKLSRNHKFLIAFASCLIFWAILLGLLIGCNTETKEMHSAQGKSMLVKIGEGEIASRHYTIVYDVDTNIEYIIIGNHISPLYSADGYKLYFP